MVDKDKIDVLNQIRREAAEDLDELQRDYAALKMRLVELETENQKQLEQINQLLVEKDQLQQQIVDSKDILLAKEREASEARAHSQLLETREATENEHLKAQLSAEYRRNGHLEEQLTELQEQMRTSQVKLQRAKEFIKQQEKAYHEKVEEAATKGGNYEEAVGSLQSELDMKEQQYKELQEKYNAHQSRWKREQLLMMSAWHEMSKSIARDVVNRGAALGALSSSGASTAIMSPGSGMSWLNQQRRLSDIQSRKRAHY